jgi:transposase
MVNGIVSINRPGAQWRELDSKYPPWQSVYYHFGQFKIRGIWEELLGSLAVKERVGQKREETPSRLAIDSHSIKIRQFIEEETGVEGNKRINGRKRSIAVDWLGLPWSLAVTAANTSDNEAGHLVVACLKGKLPRLKVIAADHGYKPGRWSGKFR